MGAVSAFTTGNYHCKPLMTDVIVIQGINVSCVCSVQRLMVKTT